MKRLRLAIASSLNEEDRILDIGCGTGDLFEALKQSNREAGYYGVDYSEAMLKQSSIPLSQRHCQDFFLFAEAHQERYDAVFALGFTTYLELEDLPLFYQSSCKLLRPDGKIIVSYTNEAAHDYRWRKWINAAFGYFLPTNRSLGRNFPIYATTPENIQQSVAEYGLEITRVSWLPPTIPFLSQLLFQINHFTLTDDLEKWGPAWRGDFIIELSRKV